MCCASRVGTLWSPSLGCVPHQTCLAGEASPPCLGLTFHQFPCSSFSDAGLASRVTGTTPGLSKHSRGSSLHDLVKRVLIGLFSGYIPFFLLVGHFPHCHTLKLPVGDQYSFKN